MNTYLYGKISRLTITEYTQKANRTSLFLNFSSPHSNPILNIILNVMAVLSSSLTYSSTFGLFMLIMSPAVTMYNMAIVVSTYLFPFFYPALLNVNLIYIYLEKVSYLYHYTTGFTSILIYAFFLYLGG